jgi:hypothetical protein
MAPVARKKVVSATTIEDTCSWAPASLKPRVPINGKKSRLLPVIPILQEDFSPSERLRERTRLRASSTNLAPA